MTKTRGRRAAVRFLKKLIRRYGKPKQLVTDRLRAYGAALKKLGLVDEREYARHANNRAENSHLPFRRRERAMLRFRRMRSLQKFVAVHAAVCNHFNLDRSLTKRTYFTASRTAALREWRQVCTG